MKSYIEVTGQQIIDAAKKCQDYPPNYYQSFIATTIRINNTLFMNKNDKYHKVLVKSGHNWIWMFSIPESWYQKLKEEGK